jgi:hypothetical protein
MSLIVNVIDSQCGPLLREIRGKLGLEGDAPCRDNAAFEALIRWYASAKFSESNCNWIDKNDWDDTMAEIDQRVFQGFVWGEAPGQ